MPPEPSFDDPFTRTRHQFGGDAINALNGIKHVLASLSVGYTTLNQNPPHDTYTALCASVDQLITETTAVYTRP